MNNNICSESLYKRAIEIQQVLEQTHINANIVTMSCTLFRSQITYLLQLACHINKPRPCKSLGFHSCLLEQLKFPFCSWYVYIKKSCNSNHKFNFSCQLCFLKAVRTINSIFVFCTCTHMRTYHVYTATQKRKHRSLEPKVTIRRSLSKVCNNTEAPDWKSWFHTT